MEFLDSLLRQPHATAPRTARTTTRNDAPRIVRNTGTIPTRQATGAIATKPVTERIPTARTAANPVPDRSTGAIHTKRATERIPTARTAANPVPDRGTGAIPTKHATGAITRERQTGTLGSKRATGVHTPGSSGAITVRRNTSTTARYSIEEDDHYRGGGNSAIIYTAGTNLFWVILIAIIIWLVVSMAQASPNQSVVSEYSQSTSLRAVAQIIGIQLPNPTVAPAAIIIPPGESSILGTPTITAAQIDAILAANNSPAAGTGAIWVEAGIQYGIDPIYGLAFFMHESSYGTNPQWAGIKPDGTTTHNVGNIICAGYRSCFGRFRDYPDWRTGIYDWYRLIAVEYIQWRGLATVEGILPVYAPAIENDVPRYVNTIKYAVAEWRQTNLTPIP